MKSNGCKPSRHSNQACALSWCMEAQHGDWANGVIFCGFSLQWKKNSETTWKASEASSSSAVCIGLEPAMSLIFDCWDCWCQEILHQWEGLEHRNYMKLLIAISEQKLYHINWCKICMCITCKADFASHCSGILYHVFVMPLIEP